jgi:phosphoserine aminotransferase
MQRKINFNAGPAEMPPEVLHEASKAVKKYSDTGLSILELPHRGKDFMDILEESKSLVRELCGLDNSYEVLWLQGGGRLQFSMIPMNFLPEKGSAGYIDSGHWSSAAIDDARHFGDVQVLASSKADNYNHLPEWPGKIPAQLAYLHMTTNNTIYGTQWRTTPKTKMPLIADMSSDILSCRRDYTQYAMFYAAAQKNLGAAGTALAVIRKDLLDATGRTLPPMLTYKAHVKENSVLNTANVFGVYVSLLMLRWIKAKGIDAIERENKNKAHLIYDAIDSSSIFTANIKEKTHRSIMNACFTANTPEVEKGFLEVCDRYNIVGIKGHRSAGGFRVSLYNAIPQESVELLVDLMKRFEKSLAA